MAELQIERDARVMSAGREIGRVTHVIVDPDTKEVTDIVLVHEGHESTIPITAVASAERGVVQLRAAGAALPQGEFDRDDFRGVDDRTADAENTGRADHGGAPLRDAADDAVTIGRPVPQPDAAAAARAAVAGQDAATTTTTSETLRIPVAEERLIVGTRAVETGAVDIRKTVVTEERTVLVTLRHEEVHIAERVVDERPATGDTLFRATTMRIELRGQEPVVAKEAVVTSEVVLAKEAVAEERQITDTIRRQQVMVDGAVRPASARPGGDVDGHERP